MRIFDAHAHILEHEDWHDVFANAELHMAISSSFPENAEYVRRLADTYSTLYCTFGVHPMYASFCLLERMKPYLEVAGAIGEIGMDNTWCNTEITLQRNVFYRQLEMAEEFRKPVILHTKGCELEIAEMIKGLTVPVLVHWYSRVLHLELFIEKGCMFTVGPDVHLNPAVGKLAGQVPVDRLMVESDGISGLEWALGIHAKPFDMGVLLNRTVRHIAEIKGLKTSETGEKLFLNALNFYNFHNTKRVI